MLRTKNKTTERSAIVRADSNDDTAVTNVRLDFRCLRLSFDAPAAADDDDDDDADDASMNSAVDCEPTQRLDQRRAQTRERTMKVAIVQQRMQHSVRALHRAAFVQRVCN